MADKILSDKLRGKTHEYRRLILQLCNKAKGLHIGGDLSSAEILVSLFQHQLNIDPKRPDWDGRDRFILSKGHGGAALYLVMAQRGYMEMEELFNTYKQHETRFGMHPCKELFPALDSSSGSLGHGLPIAAGMALAAKMDGKKHRVYCLIGDGEMNEGSVWEAAMAAAQLKLGNLVAIVDVNRMCLDGFTEEIMNVEPVTDKWKAFNWNLAEIDGNDIGQILDAFDHLPAAGGGKPTVIVARTVKGKGVSFLQNEPAAHHTSINDDQLKAALAEVDAAYESAKGGKNA
ncbi:MAG: transketolase [Peptococcaceae bacterium]|jgi:transketolase|nr:transketolase [Peptococcaceae bacterium]